MEFYTRKAHVRICLEGLMAAVSPTRHSECMALCFIATEIAQQFIVFSIAVKTLSTVGYYRYFFSKHAQQ